MSKALPRPSTAAQEIIADALNEQGYPFQHKVPGTKQSPISTGKFVSLRQIAAIVRFPQILFDDIECAILEFLPRLLSSENERST